MIPSTNRRWQLFLAIAIASGVGAWLIKSHHLVLPWHPAEQLALNHLDDFAAQPIMALWLLLSALLIPRLRGHKWLGVWCAGVAGLFEEVVEFNGRASGVLPFQAHPTHWWQPAINLADNYLGHVFDWRDVAAVMLATVITMACLWPRQSNCNVRKPTLNRVSSLRRSTTGLLGAVVIVASMLALGASNGSTDPNICDHDVKGCSNYTPPPPPPAPASGYSGCYKTISGGWNAKDNATGQDVLLPAGPNPCG